MADSSFKPAPRKKVALDNNKLSMSAPNSKGKRSSLQWQLINNNPRIVVYTNDPDDQVDYGKITAALDAPTFFAFMGLIEQAISAEKGFKEKIDNLNYTWGGGKRSDTPTVVSSLLVGKDDDGVIWIAVSAPRRPQIKFPFMNPEFHNFIHRDGTPYEKPEVSSIMAKAYVDVLRLLMANLLVTEYVEPKPKDDRGNNNRGSSGGSNTNRGNSWGGAGEERPKSNFTDMEESMPW